MFKLVKNFIILILFYNLFSTSFASPCVVEQKNNLPDCAECRHFRKPACVDCSDVFPPPPNCCRKGPKSEYACELNAGYYDDNPCTTPCKFAAAHCPINPCYYAKNKYPDRGSVYMRLGGGGSFMNNLNAGNAGGDIVIGNQTVFYNGFDAEFAIGYRFLSNFRTELEYNYIYNQIMKNGDGTTNLDVNNGGVNINAAFFNVLYNFNINSKFEPYAGAGVGYLWSRYNWEFDNADPANSYSTEPAGMGYQAILGVGYPLTKQVSLSLDYRYLYAQTGTHSISNGADPVSSGRYQFNMSTNLVNLGVTYRF